MYSTVHAKGIRVKGHWNPHSQPWPKTFKLDIHVFEHYHTYSQMFNVKPKNHSTLIYCSTVLPKQARKQQCTLCTESFSYTTICRPLFNRDFFAKYRVKTKFSRLQYVYSTVFCKSVHTLISLCICFHLLICCGRDIQIIIRVATWGWISISLSVVVSMLVGSLFLSPSAMGSCCLFGSIIF